MLWPLALRAGAPVPCKVFPALLSLPELESGGREDWYAASRLTKGKKYEIFASTKDLV